MAIQFKTGNIFDEPVAALVNTVNTVGVMGKGLALQFKERFPNNFKWYRQACEKQEVQIGKMFITPTDTLIAPQYIINFPTKKHWRGKTQIAFIESGLQDLKKTIINHAIPSIAIPPLGCGYGGLQWKVVKPLITKVLADLTNTNIIIFEPSNQVYQTKRKRKKTTPKLTEFRAFILQAGIRYKELKYYELTLLEFQKLAYFLQRLGINLKLTFDKYHYGPYSNALNNALYDLDGYYLDGMKYKTAGAFDEIEIKTDKITQIKDFIQNQATPQQQQSLEQLNQLIDGFESPLGMELLATVDYLMDQYPNTVNNKNALLKAIKNWSPRKARLMKPYYVVVTMNRLLESKHILYPKASI